MQSKRLLLFVALYIIPLSGVGTDLYSPSLPALVSALSAPVSLVKLTLGVYLFGFSIGQVINGTLSDIYGRKPLLIFSLSLFVIASFAATMVQNIYFLLFVRVLQGIAAAGPSVIAKAIFTDTMEGPELKHASIYMVTIWGLSPIIAPAIGGYLQHYYGWQSNFYFFAAYSLTMLVAVIALLKETNLNLAEPDWHKVVKNYMSIAAHKVFIANVICMALAYSIIMIFNIFTPFLVQDILGYSAITYGHMAMLVGVAFLLGSLSNRWFMSYFKTQTVNRVSMILLAAITLLMIISVYFTKMTLISIITPVFFLVLIVGLLQTNFMTHTLSLFPHMGGTASAALGSILCLIAGIITSSGSLINHTTTSIPVSWIYTGMIFIYCTIYWLYLDAKTIE